MTDLLGNLVGNYQLEALLETTPAGPRYAGRHVRLQRPASIKLFDPALTATPAARAALLDTLRRVTALRHPHLVEVFDIGESDHRFFLVTELLPGGSLRSLLQRLQSVQARTPLASALTLARQAATALAAAHSHGLLHGAIRPEILLLSAPGATGTLKVSDLGLASLFPAEATAAPSYLTPEQLRGLPVDARSDVYGLGTVLYELLIGAPPFGAATLEQAAASHRRARLVPPRVVRPQIPLALETVVLRCLASDPAERFANGGELAEALRQAEAAMPRPTPVAAPPVQSTPADHAPLLNDLLGAAPTPPAEPAPARSGPQVALQLEQQQLTLTPGRPGIISARVQNLGPVADRFSLALEGVAATWVREGDPPVELGPGASTPMALVVTVPAAASAGAGDYPVVVRARALAQATSATARLVLTVRPFVAATLTIAPDEAAGQVEGDYRLTLRNEGNVAASFLLSAEDPQRLLAYELGQETVQLAPGQTTGVPLTVVAPRRLFGSPEGFRFSVFAESEGAEPVEAQAEFVQTPWLPAWVPLAIAIAALLGVLLIGFLLNRERGGEPPIVSEPPTAVLAPQPGAPVVIVFTVEPAVVAPGEPVNVSWAVRDAERVTIDQFGDVPLSGQRTFRPETTTDFRLVATAGNQETVSIQRVLVAEATAAPEATAVPTLEPPPTLAPLPPPAPTATTLPPVEGATPPPAVPGSIALIELAPEARWETDAGPIFYGRPAENAEQGGWAATATQVALENGSIAPLALLTVPRGAALTPGEGQLGRRVSGPWIEARFALPQIQAGQFFLADIGFAQGAAGPGLDVLVSFNNELLYEGRVLPDGALTAISADLAPYVGRAGQLILRVSVASPADDSAPAPQELYWVQPRIDLPPRPAGAPLYEALLVLQRHRGQATLASSPIHDFHRTAEH